MLKRSRQQRWTEITTCDEISWSSTFGKVLGGFNGLTKSDVLHRDARCYELCCLIFWIEDRPTLKPLFLSYTFKYRVKLVHRPQIICQRLRLLLSKIRSRKVLSRRSTDGAVAANCQVACLSNVSWRGMLFSRTPTRDYV